MVFPIASGSCEYDYYDYESCSTSWNGGMVAGALIGTAGLALTVVGASILPSRIIRRKRRTGELTRIDAELRSLGVQASVAPLLGRDRAGMQATVRF